MRRGRRQVGEGGSLAATFGEAAAFDEDNVQTGFFFFRRDVGERRSLEALAKNLFRVEGLGLRA